MFEILDAEILSELAKLDAPATLNKKTRLSDLITCLEQAALECRIPAATNAFSANDAETVATGINAAQRIVEEIWKPSIV